MLNTKLSLNDIECLLVNYFGGCRMILAVPNVYWGLLDHEADLIIVTAKRYITEIEIKRSWTDFVNDFKKKHIHQDDKNRIARFYYAVPDSISDKVIAYLEEHMEDCSHLCGVITYLDEKPANRYHLQLYIKKEFKKRNKGVQPITIEDMYQLARLGTLRMWKMKNKIASETGAINMDKTLWM